MDQNRAPLLEALAEYHRHDRYGFTPPGHRRGAASTRGRSRCSARTCSATMCWPPPGWTTAPRRAAYLKRRRGADGRRGRRRACVLLHLRQLAVGQGGDAGGRRPHGDLLRQPRRAQVGGRRADLLRRCEPRWVRRAGTPSCTSRTRRRREESSEAWDAHPDAAGALVVSPTPYGTCADIAGDRRGLPRAGQAADRRRGVGRAPAVPRRPADLGDGRRRRRLRRQRPQDGRRLRAGIGVPRPGRPRRPRAPVGSAPTC